MCRFLSTADTDVDQACLKETKNHRAVYSTLNTKETVTPVPKKKKKKKKKSRKHKEVKKHAASTQMGAEESFEIDCTKKRENPWGIDDMSCSKSQDVFWNSCIGGLIGKGGGWVSVTFNDSAELWSVFPLFKPSFFFWLWRRFNSALQLEPLTGWNGAYIPCFLYYP